MANTVRFQAELRALDCAIETVRLAYRIANTHAPTAADRLWLLQRTEELLAAAIASPEKSPWRQLSLWEPPDSAIASPDHVFVEQRWRG